MNSLEETQSKYGESGTVSTQSTALTLPVFAATLFLSAFLLFSVQPFFTKMVLPTLGGTPAVWSVVMVFFQAMLLAGYAYAHLLTTRFSVRNAAFIHIGVMVAASLFLPTQIPAGWGSPPESGQAFWLLGLFAVVIGLPFFAVSANGPLLQAWFARTGHPHADDPYFLYGASNIGSFASLILYIIAFEPLMTLGGQALAWTVGFVVLGFSIMTCALLVRSRMQPLPLSAETREDAIVQEHVGDNATVFSESNWTTRAQWMLYAAVPSGLLVAVTAHMSVDIASIPFLWVVPLALFLLTFVIAFARNPIITTPTLSRYLPFFAAAVLMSAAASNKMPLAANLFIHLGFFFVATLMSHSLLVAKRPKASELTGFYFWMSLGGVLGGAFTTLMAPVLFDWVAEYMILVVAALLIRPEMWRENAEQTRKLIYVGAIIVLAFSLRPVGDFASQIIGKDMLVNAFNVLVVVSVAAGLFRLVPSMAILFVACGLNTVIQGHGGDLYLDRSFFGVLRANEIADGKITVMRHGTTIHGAITNENRFPPEPITYYHASGGIAESLFAAQAIHPARDMHVGIVGLGVGSMLCHRRKDETWTLFEIDAAILALAHEDRIFNYMSACSQPQDESVLGDARLKMVDQADNKFDYLLVDAFSSNSIPVHLLTLEALELYKSKLSENGVLSIHISNRYMELESVVAAIAKEAGLVGRVALHMPKKETRTRLISGTKVVTLARNEAAFSELEKDPRWKPLEDVGTTAWTDDYSNVLAAIWRFQTK